MKILQSEPIQWTHTTIDTICLMLNIVIFCLFALNHWVIGLFVLTKGHTKWSITVDLSFLSPLSIEWIFFFKFYISLPHHTKTPIDLILVA